MTSEHEKEESISKTTPEPPKSSKRGSTATRSGSFKNPPGTVGKAPVARRTATRAPRTAAVASETVGSDPGALSVAGPGDAAEGPVVGRAEAEARKLADLDSPHAAAGLLVAIAERLARDVDTTAEVRDRIAATKQLLEVVHALDAALLGPGETRPTVEGDDDDDQEDPLRSTGGDRDNPFDIGDLPPGMEHPPAP